MPAAPTRRAAAAPSPAPPRDPARRPSAPRRAPALALGLAVLAACASPVVTGYEGVPPRDPTPPRLVNDPIEPFNQASFAVTDAVWSGVAAPVSRGWRAVVGRGARRRVDNVAHNLEYPRRLVSCLLQGRGADAAEETGRFLLNTTVGLLGVFDPAASLGWERHDEDVGQALGTWGVGRGFYLVVPLAGPDSGRDALAGVADVALDLATYLPPLVVVFGVNAFADRVDDYEALVARESDPYPLARERWAATHHAAVHDVAPTGTDEGMRPALGALLVERGPDDFRRRVEHDRVAIPATGGHLPYSAWWQDGRAPLVVVVPGMDGYRDGTMVWSLARALHEGGAHVVAMSGALHWEFLRHASTVAVPGYTPADARDVHRAAAALVREAADGHEVTGTSLLGLSLGAAQVLGIAADVKRGSAAGPAFDRYVALSPPVDPEHTIHELDRFYRAPLEWPADEREARVMGTLAEAAAVIAERPSLRRLTFDRTQSEYLLGLTYRAILQSALFELARQERLPASLADAASAPGGLPRARWWRTGPIQRALGRVTWEEYVRDALLPTLASGGEVGAPWNWYVEAAGLRAIGTELRRDPAVRVIANRDDFVLRPEDAAWLTDVLGDRLRLFERGGHLGNLHREAVRRAIVAAALPARRAALSSR